MLAELVDAVVGVDTHRDTHQATGYAELPAWIVDHTPSPRLVVSIEGTRSYGVGLARAAAAASLIVVEGEWRRRGR
jgi:transposase